MKKITLENIGSEALAFAGIPLIEPKGTIEVSEEEAKILLRNGSLKMVEPKKTNSKAFKGIEND